MGVTIPPAASFPVSSTTSTPHFFPHISPCPHPQVTLLYSPTAHEDVAIAATIPFDANAVALAYTTSLAPPMPAAADDMDGE